MEICFAYFDGDMGVRGGGIMGCDVPRELYTLYQTNIELTQL
jgi:hypothetical protein